MFGDRGGQRQFSEDGALPDPQIGQRAGIRIAWVLLPEYEVENHFQFDFYSIPFPAVGNDESHTQL